MKPKKAKRRVLFNINDNVRVKLTGYGRSILAQQHAEFIKAHPTARPEYHPHKEDAQGWSEWQMWVLMTTFGPHIYLGGYQPFETTIEMTLDP